MDAIVESVFKFLSIVALLVFAYMALKILLTEKAIAQENTIRFGALITVVLIIAAVVFSPVDNDNAVTGMIGIRRVAQKEKIRLSCNLYTIIFEKVGKVMPRITSKDAYATHGQQACIGGTLVDYIIRDIASNKSK